MSRSQRRAMIDREEPKLSLVRQCALLGISRSSLYYLPTEAGAEDLELMALIDQQYLKTPFYGSRRMTAWRRNHGHQVNRKRVRRLMQLIGLEAIYRRPNTSKPNPGHKVYPYLLRGLEINRVNQVWATDWGRMAIVDTKPFKLRVILHRIFVERPQVTGIPAWPGGAACYRRSRYIL